MRYFYTVAIVLLASHAISFSQTIPVRGKVKTEDGSAAAGVTVQVKGTKTATTTDTKGEFQIGIPKFPSTLIFTWIGYELKNRVIKKADSAKYISIKLQPNTSSLEEVVVVGYGMSRKSSFTGASTPVFDKSSSPSLVRQKSQGISTIEKGNTTGILTAGELSDFKKWKLWADYSKYDFSQYSERWGIAPVNRYCVQVQNEDRKGMAGEKVYLIDFNTKDTAWRSITDNTGKAELWGNFYRTEENQSKYAIVCGTETIRFPSIFENGINRITLKKNCDHSNIADIAFVVDATGSMGDEIKYLQEELQDVINRASESNKDIRLRIGSVFYRDRGDDYVTRSIDFQSDASALLQFIKNQSAGGGGDFPEAVEDALTVALDNLHWDPRSRAKILFLILDAPPHDAAKDKMKMLMARAAAMGIRIVPIVCSGIDKSTEYLMRSLALATNGSYVFLTDDSGVGDEHIKPTTDNFKVELLNDILQRVITEMTYIASCNEREKMTEPVFAEKNIAKVVVFPNPSTGRIQIRSREQIKELYIADFAGKLLQKMQVNNKGQNWSTDLSSYPSGTYIIKYFTEEKGWGAEKIILVK